MLAATLAPACSDPEEQVVDQPYIPPDSEGNWILVDNIHSTKQNPDLKLERNNYNYQGMHGFYRLFQQLDTHGYPYRQIAWDPNEDTRLTAEVLKDFKVLFINLISDDQPDFTQDEIAAITDWVEGGGGLFVIADHTNVYHHAERLNPLLATFGIEVLFSTAVDSPPQYAINSFWVKIRSFADHPVTDGVSVVSFQTGGPLVTDDGVAFLSNAGFSDDWIEAEANPGFYGNGRLDPGEPSGPLPVVAATNFGEGRVVVVGDQNVFGDEWVMVGQNFEIVLNIFEWLARNEFADPHLRDLRTIDQYEVGFEVDHSVWNIGTNACSGYFPFYINFNRAPSMQARGIVEFTGKERALVFTDPTAAYSAAEINQIKGYLKDGKPVVIVTDITRAGAGSTQLIRELLPEVTFHGKETFGAEALPAGEALVATQEAASEFPVSSSILEVAGRRLSGQLPIEGGQCEPKDTWRSYVRMVTADGGTPLLQADVDGQTVDLARIYEVDGGKVILFLQDGFWRNETLGWERMVPTAAHDDAHQVEYAFIDWLMTQ